LNWVYPGAWLLPLSAGVAVYLAFNPQRVAGWKIGATGYGFFLGMLLTGMATSVVARTETTQAWKYAGGCLLLVLIFAAPVAWRRRMAATPLPSASIARWMHVPLGILIASLVFRGWIVAREIWLRPLYPWDAWSAWAVKPKVWFLLGHYVPFVSPGDWLRAWHENVHTEVAWHYPNALAWIEVWFASAADGWVEPLINLPWLGLWVALLLGHYGQWRALGLDRTRALLCIYALGSLPLLTVHAALAGYADLWVAAAFGFSVLSWVRWLRWRDRGQLCTALICAVVLPWLKMEGWIWATCLLGAIGFGTLPRRWQSWLGTSAAVLFVALFPLGGLRFLCLHAGVQTADGSAAIPAIGPLALLLKLQWRSGALTSTVETLFAQPNWNLLWWLAPAVLAWRWRELVAHDWLRLPALLLGVCSASLLVLFFFTDASVWAQSYTAINRLVLQLAPAWVTLLALLLRDACWPGPTNDTVRASAPRFDPG